MHHGLEGGRQGAAWWRKEKREGREGQLARKEREIERMEVELARWWVEVDRRELVVREERERGAKEEKRGVL